MRGRACTSTSRLCRMRSVSAITRSGRRRPTARTPSSPLAWIGALTYRIRLGTAILQMAARTPAMTAMTAMTLDALSGGRVLLGLGVSGPQVVEGWHGQPFGKPLGRTREYVSIVRAILARERPLEHAGEHYQIPYRGPDATGLGKPLRSIVHGARRPPDLPRRDRAEERRARRGDRRRLAARVLLAGARRPLPPGARRGLRPGGRRASAIASTSPPWRRWWWVGTWTPAAPR